MKVGREAQGVTPTEGSRRSPTDVRMPSREVVLNRLRGANFVGRGVESKTIYMRVDRAFAESVGGKDLNGAGIYTRWQEALATLDEPPQVVKQMDLGFPTVVRALTDNKDVIKDAETTRREVEELLRQQSTKEE